MQRGVGEQRADERQIGHRPVPDLDPDPARAVRAARRTLRGAEVEVGDRPAVGEPITVEVTYRSVTDLPLVGALFPDPALHGRVSMRVER